MKWEVTEELVMKAIGQYDGTLQMFKDQPGEVNMARLRFLRWLGERDRLEHQIAGASTGAFAVTPESAPDVSAAHSEPYVWPKAS